MKRILLTMMLFLCANVMTFAQQGESTYGDAVKADVKMNYVYTLEKAIATAKKAHKPIFFNCFADWAIPCHSMNKLVFSDKPFCDWMDKNFVNLFIDVSLPENSNIVEKYNITFFAHFLVLDENGEVIYRIVGGKPVEQFKAILQNALNPKLTLKYLTEQYQSGNRNKKIVREYAKALLLANYNDEFDNIKDEYLGMIDKSELTKAENYNIFTRINENAESEWFDFLLKNKNAFAKNNGAKKIDDYIASMFIRYFYPYALSTFEYNSDKLQSVYKKFLDADLTEKSQKEVELYYQLAKTRGDKKIDQFLDLVEENVPTMHVMMQSYVDLSLKDIPDMTPQQQDRVTKYLTARAEKQEGTAKDQYMAALKEVNTTEGIKFEKETFEELLVRAKKENRPIFLDCYTSWCGPCKILAKQVFTQKVIGDYFNTNFLCIKLDMEKGEGVSVGKKYGVHVFPTLIFIDPDGEIITKSTGACPPADLMKQGKQALFLAANLKPIVAKYESGDRTPETVAKYLVIMQQTGKIENITKEVDDYFFGVKDKERISAAMWPIIDAFGNSGTKVMNYVVANGDKYVKVIDKDVFYSKIEKVFFPILLEMVKEGCTAKDITRINGDIKKLCIDKNSALGIFSDLIVLFNEKDVYGLLDVYKDRVAKMTDNKGRLNLDMLMMHFIKIANGTQKNEIRSYIDDESKVANDRMINTYKALIAEIN